MRAIHPNILWVTAATVIALAVGSVLRLLAARRATPEAATERRKSLATWWGVMLVVLGAALLGSGAAAMLFTALSIMAFREFWALAVQEDRLRRLEWAAYVLIAASYFCIWRGRLHVFAAFLPVIAVAASSTVLMLSGRTTGFIKAAACFLWGLLTFAYLPAHAVLLFTLPDDGRLVAGVVGWFMFLVLLTGVNDISQALVGRRIGKRRIAPTISPNKTWEGFFGGVAVTTALAVALADWITPFHWNEAAAAGLVIAVSGFLGDLNVSAVKRDCGVKDNGRLLPGHGGILDRIDSLTFSAPAFYYFIHFTQDAGLSP